MKDSKLESDTSGSVKSHADTSIRNKAIEDIANELEEIKSGLLKKYKVLEEHAKAIEFQAREKRGSLTCKLYTRIHQQ